MKRIVVAAMFILSIASIARAQSFGEVARAERRRKQEVTVGKTMPIVRVMPVTEKPVVTETTKAEATKPEEPKVEPAKTEPTPSQNAELADLQSEKSSLLVKLGHVIRDRKAVEDIEQRLAEIQKRTDELKQR